MNSEICKTGNSFRVKVKVTQSCLILCDPRDYTVHEILQARIVECVPYSRVSSQPRDQPRSPALHADSFFFFCLVFLIFLFYFTTNSATREA